MEVVTYEVEASIGRCTINRPEKLNALNHEVVVGLGEVLDQAAADDTRVLLVTGAGSSFSAGYDLSQEVEDHHDGAASWHRALEADVEMTMRLFSFPKPTIAVVRGWCLAGGCELAMACDLIVATEQARFGEPEIRYGSGPVTLLMPFIIGQKKTNELLFTGDTIDGVEAERLGLVNRAVPEDALDETARELARRIAVAPKAVLSFTKRALVRSAEATGLLQAVQANLDISAILNSTDSPEQQEWDRIVAADGLKAALAWRDARYASGLGS